MVPRRPRCSSGLRHSRGSVLHPCHPGTYPQGTFCRRSAWRRRRRYPGRTLSAARRLQDRRNRSCREGSRASRRCPWHWGMCPAHTPRAAQATRQSGRNCLVHTAGIYPCPWRSGTFPPCTACTRRCASRVRTCRLGMPRESQCQWCKRGPLGSPRSRPPSRGSSCSSSCQPRTAAAPPRQTRSSCPSCTAGSPSRSIRSGRSRPHSWRTRRGR